MPKIKIPLLPVLDGFEDGDIQIRSFGQFNTKIHCHQKTQLIAAEKGTLYLYSEKGSYCIPAHYYAYIAASLEHKFISRSQRVEIKTIFLELPQEITCNGKTLDIAIFPPSSLLDNFLSFGEQHWPGHQNPDLKTASLQALKKMLPFLLTKPIYLYTHPPKSEALLKAVEFITGALGENLTVPSISKAANIPERTLSRLFKQETGMTIFQFIKTSRMQKALELMEDPSMNISEIVYHIGYESTATFSNLFKQLVGISPQKYRQRFLLLA
jgi:AraC-like DNA-binding protein